MPGDPRSPVSPLQPRQEGVPPTGLVRTDHVHKWLTSIEQHLAEICTIASESKLNMDQKNKIQHYCRKVTVETGHILIEYQAAKQKAMTNFVALEASLEKEELADRLSELKVCIKETAQPKPSSSSYADTVKIRSNTAVRPATTSSIAIFPARLTLEEPTKRRPKIILLGVPSSTTENELKDCIFEQNIAEKQPSFSKEKAMSSIRLSHKSGKKEAASCNFILEVTAEIRKLLIHQGRVFINWTSCPVKDFTLVTRCYKCQQYGHSAKFCKDANPTCGHCGTTGHSIKECTKKNQPEKCATCQRFNKPSTHKTGDDNCPARKSAELRHLNSIDYEGA
ncbi:hypothetical protein NE865_11438 [Phthorimaea operculella]|nr:hypothetical protein NE865_11438 [Phthorimaea operculella]